MPNNQPVFIPGGAQSSTACSRADVSSQVSQVLALSAGASTFWIHWFLLKKSRGNQETMRFAIKYMGSLWMLPETRALSKLKSTRNTVTQGKPLTHGSSSSKCSRSAFEYRQAFQLEPVQAMDLFAIGMRRYPTTLPVPALKKDTVHSIEMVLPIAKTTAWETSQAHRLFCKPHISRYK